MAAPDARDGSGHRDAAPTGQASDSTSNGATSIVRDTSNAGGPSIPALTQNGADGAGAASMPAQDGEELVVEVELAAGADAVASGLTGDMAGFLGGIDGAAPPSGASLGGILRRHHLQEAKPVFSREQIEEERRRRAEAALGASVPEQISALERMPPLGSFIRLRFPGNTPPAEITAELKQVPEVARAVVVPRAAPPGQWEAANRLAPMPTDPLIGTGQGPITADPGSGVENQWYLHRTRVPAAWNYSRGANVVVADLDWGYRTTHRELRAAVERQYNAVDGGNDVSQGPAAAHGTAVTGIAAARADGQGMAGYAPEASVWAIQADSAPAARVFNEPWVEAIDFVRRTSSGDRRKVIILEVQTANGGNYEQIPSVARAIRGAIADGCVVCVAVGNGNRPADQTDSGDFFEPTGSILVGATAYHSELNKRAWFSNFGSRIVVSAPGDTEHDVTCGQSADDSYRNGFGGTSGATPKVAGTAALMLSVNPGLSHEEVRDILAGTGSSLTEDPGKPIGVFLNAEAAVAEALQRRLDAEAAALPLQEGEPVPVGATPHGVHRRKSRKVLPQQWEDFLSSGDYPPETYADIPAGEAAAAAGEQPPAGDKLLRVFRETVEGTLTLQDRLLMVSQAIRMLDGFYVHRHLKEAIHAVRPIQRLRVLQRRLQQAANNPAGLQDELAFHNSLTQIFNSVRDLHTGYQLPLPYSSHVAYLPFEVAPFFEDDQRRYLVTRVIPGYEFADQTFGPGAELLYWNGTSIERAVLANAEQTAGGNEAARHARGVSALTIRPMDTALPPDADFVDLDFLKPDAAGSPAERRRMRQHWFVRFIPASGATGAIFTVPPQATAVDSGNVLPPDIRFASDSSLDQARESTARMQDILYSEPTAPAAAAPLAIPLPAPELQDLGLAASLGLDNAADSVREARQLIFASARPGSSGSASPESVQDTVQGQEVAVSEPWKAAFRARTIDIDGRSYGHIQIQTFNLPDPDGFVQEFIRLLERMPETGLILDVRGNGGGNILAAERLLQTLACSEIEPERLQFIATSGTLDLALNNPSTSPTPLDQWKHSLEEAVETGSVYSQAFPLTSKDSCNAIGQKYYGPVVLIVDGNCYSATDMFAAGFQDHDIGKVIGVDTNTGAGGANVWGHWLLHRTLPPGWGLTPLPNQAGMRVAIRQCLRVGPRAGSLLEDFGVAPDKVHRPERKDVMDGYSALFERAAQLLADKSPHSIKVTVAAADPGSPSVRQVTIRTRGLKRLDSFVDGRPRDSRDLSVNSPGEGTLTAAVREGATLRLEGYTEPGDNVRSAHYLGQIR